MDDLIARIEFGDDEVNRRSISQHSMLIRIFVGPKTRKRRQQAVMKIHDATGESPTGTGRKHAHIARKNDVIDLILVEQFDHSLIVWLAAVIPNSMPVDFELIGHSSTTITIAD